MPEKFVQENQEQASAVSKERLGRDLFANIDRLSRDVGQGLEKRKEEILTWPEETKEAEAGTSDDLLVINLLSKQPDLNIRTAIALNPNIPSGVTRRFIEDDNETLIPLSINPNLSRAFIELIIAKKKKFSDNRQESILIYLLANHPECTELLKKKNDFLNGMVTLDSEDVNLILSSYKRLPCWIGTVLKRDGFLKEIILNISSFVDPNGVLSDLTLGSDNRQLRTIMDYLLETEGVKGLVLSNELAEEFISKGQGVWVLDNISLFPSLSLDRVFATRLLKAEYVDTLAENIKMFNFDDPEQFLSDLKTIYEPKKKYGSNYLYFARLVYALAVEQKDFQQYIFEKDFFEFFIEFGVEDLIGDIIEKCSDKDLLNENIADLLIENGKFDILKDNIQTFKITNYRLLITKIFEQEHWFNDAVELIEEILKMPGVVCGNSEAKILIDNSQGWIVYNNLDKFDDLSEEVAIELIKDKDTREKIINSPEKFKDIGHNFIIALIREGLMNDQLIKKISHLKGFDISNFEKAIMESKPTVDGARIIMQNPELFKIMNDAKTFLLYISNIFPPNSSLFFENFERFKILGSDYVAEEMINAGLGSDVVNNLERFKGVNRKKIAELLLSFGHRVQMDRNFSEFILEKKNPYNEYYYRQFHPDKGDLQELRGEMERNPSLYNQADLIADNIEKFDDVVPDKTKLIVDLIRDGKHKHLDTGIWMYYLEKFKGLDFKKVALALLDYGGVKLDEDSDEQTVVTKLVENGHSSFFLDYFEHFKGVNVNDFILKIIENGQPLTLFYSLRTWKGGKTRVDIKLSARAVLGALTKMGELMDTFKGAIPNYFSDLEQTEEFMLNNKDLFRGLRKDSIKKIFRSLRLKERRKR